MSTGLTKDAGWQLGVRRKVPAPLEEVWDFLLGDGLPLWLGSTVLGKPGDLYATAEGVKGEIRSRTEHVRIRLTWQPNDWNHDSTLQLTVIPAANGTTVAIHQEQLTSAEERAELLEHWHGVVEGLVKQFSA